MDFPPPSQPTYPNAEDPFLKRLLHKHPKVSAGILIRPLWHTAPPPHLLGYTVLEVCVKPPPPYHSLPASTCPLSQDNDYVSKNTHQLTRTFKYQFWSEEDLGLRIEKRPTSAAAIYANVWIRRCHSVGRHDISSGGHDAQKKRWSASAGCRKNDFR